MRNYDIGAVAVLILQCQAYPAAVQRRIFFGNAPYELLALLKFFAVVVADNAVQHALFYAALYCHYEVISLSALRRFGTFSLGKLRNDVISDGYGVYHSALCLPGVNVHARNAHFKACAVECLIGNFTQLLAVDGIGKLTAELVSGYEVLLLGTSTWGDGELQDDWYDGVKVLKGMDLSDKLVGLFGCGDSESYPDTFCDGMGILYGDLKNSGCRWIGAVPAQEYTYASSISVIDGLFVGLALDEMNESDQTDARIASWAEILKADLV